MHSVRMTNSHSHHGCGGAGGGGGNRTFVQHTPSGSATGSGGGVGGQRNSRYPEMAPNRGIERLAAAGRCGQDGEAKRDAAQLLLWTINEWSKNKGQSTAAPLTGLEAKRARRNKLKVGQY